MFGTGGFRGLDGIDINSEKVIKLSKTIKNYIEMKEKNRVIVISYDLRCNSKKYAKIIASVFTFYKYKVFLSNKETPSPVCMFITKHTNASMGIMVTASHNDLIYNGIKLFDSNGQDASVEVTSQIENNYYKINMIDYEENKEYLYEIDFIKPYLDNLNKFVEVTKVKQNIIFDFIYGTGKNTIKPYLNKKNIEVKYRREIKDDLTFKTSPDPTESNLRYNKHVKGSLIFGFDHDADRLGVIDEKGNYVDNNELLALIYVYLVREKGFKGPVVKSVVTSNLIDKTAILLNEKVYNVDVGFKNITKKMSEINALIGGESSGGLTIRNYIKGKDAMLSSMLVIEIINYYNKTLNLLIKELRKEVSFYNKTSSNVIKLKNITKEIKENIFNYNFDINNLYDKVVLNNNLILNLKNDEWAVIRFSGTEPVLRIFVETEMTEKNNEIINLLTKQIRELVLNNYE